MLIQENETYKLSVSIRWLDPEQIEVLITTSNLEKGHWEHRYQSFFMGPENLARLSDYIDDTLAR